MSLKDLANISSDPQAPAPQNPANVPAHIQAISEGRMKRVPVSSAKRKLETPPIAGFSLYWFLERNVPQALQGGY